MYQFVWLFRRLGVFPQLLATFWASLLTCKPRHPEEKPTRIRQTILLLNSKKTPKHEISCLVGLLQCRVPTYLGSLCIFNIFVNQSVTTSKIACAIGSRIGFGHAILPSNRDYFPENYSLILQLRNFSTLNDLQYTVYQPCTIVMCIWWNVN